MKSFQFVMVCLFAFAMFLVCIGPAEAHGRRGSVQVFGGGHGGGDVVVVQQRGFGRRSRVQVFSGGGGHHGGAAVRVFVR